MKKIIQKYRELILYIFFGVLTTAVNYAVALASNELLKKSGIEASWPSVSIAWIISVLFAYITNRIWVFRSTKTGRKEIFAEVLAFFGARLFSGVFEVALMTLAVDIMGYKFDIMKLLCNILVIIMNYIFSKLWVFKSNKKDVLQDK